MQEYVRTPAMRYAVALVLVAGAISVRFFLQPILAATGPFALQLLALIAAAVFCGFGPALVATVAAVGVSAYLFMPPATTSAEQIGGWLRIGIGLAVGAGVAFLGGRVREDRERAKAAAAAAHAQREEFRTTMASVGDGVIVADPEGRVLALNPVAETLTGWPAAEAVGRPLGEVFTVDGDAQAAAVEDSVVRVLRTGKVVGHSNHAILLARDGARRPIEDSAAPIRGADGRVIGVVLVFRDVGDRRRTEERLRERSRQLQIATDSVPILIAHLDRDQRFKFVNRPYARRFGKEPSAIIGKTMAEILGADATEMIQPYIQRVLRGERVEYEAEVPYRDLGPQHMQCSYAPEFDADGNVVGLVASIMNITERKRAEIHAQTALGRLNLALEAARLGDWSWDAATDQVLLSPRAAEVFGLPHDRPTTWTRLLELLPENDRRRAREAVELAVSARDRYQLEHRVDRPDGVQAWVSISGHTYFAPNGRPLGMYGVAQDVTDRKRAEQDAKFLADASAILASLVDIDSALERVARLAVPLFSDWMTVDLLDETGEELRRIAAAHVDPDKVRIANDSHRRFPPKRSSQRGPWTVVRHGKSRFVPILTEEIIEEYAHNEEHLAMLRKLDLRSYIAVPLSARGRAFGVLTFIAAESGRRYTEADLVVAEDLAHRASVAIENARLFHEVREADKRKEEFLSLLAHELRNPLAPVRTGLQILKLTSGQGGQAAANIGMMERQVEHLVRLVDDLVDVSRVMRTTIELRRTPVEVARVVARAVETSQPMIQAERHALTIEVPKEPLWVDGDLVRLSQVVGNLLNNAARYTPPGGRIELRVERDETEVVLRVKDSGIGIGKDMLPKIWGMFVQADRSTTSAQAGMGIGLTLVKSLVEMHGGAVQVQSEGVGKGSEFIVRLPLTDAPSDPSLELDKVEEVRVSNEAGVNGAVAPTRVLIVDDNVDAAESLAALLRLEGHKTLIAHSGPSALKVALAAPPEIAFLDIGMPGMDGYELARKFRENPVLKEVYLVALTGWGQAEDRRRTKAAGFDAHEVKPIEPHALDRCVAEGRAASAQRVSS